MNRRKFLKFLGAGAGAAALPAVVEELPVHRSGYVSVGPKVDREVVFTVTGDVLDRKETGREIAKLIKDPFDGAPLTIPIASGSFTNTIEINVGRT